MNSNNYIFLIWLFFSFYNDIISSCKTCEASLKEDF